MDGNTVEIFVKHENKTVKVVLEGDAVKEMKDVSEKLGVDSMIEAIVYSIKILTEGLKSVGEGEHEVELPGGFRFLVKVSKKTE